MPWLMYDLMVAYELSAIQIVHAASIKVPADFDGIVHKIETHTDTSSQNRNC